MLNILWKIVLILIMGNSIMLFSDSKYDQSSREIVKRLNADANDKIIKIKREWNEKKKILCSLNQGVKKHDIEVNFNIKFVSIDCSTRIEGGQLTGTIIGYRYSSEDYKRSISVDKDYAYKVCPDKIINGKWDKECIYFNFQDNLLFETGGCK